MVNKFIVLVLQIVYTLLIVIYTSILCLLKQLVPYRYRCKSVYGEIVLVTGAGSGIGRLMAKRFAKLGAKLVLVDIDEKANENTASEISMQGGTVYTFTCDLSKRDEIYRVADEIKKTVGNIHILVNNAGIVTGKKFLDSSDDAIERTMKVNTMAHFWLCKSFLPAMLENNHGHVVTIASMAGLYGTAGLCDYTASKFGAVGFNESLRNELIRLKKTGVHTTCVCPSYINTGMFDGIKTPIIPLLEPEYVSDKVIEAVLTNQTMLLLPKAMYWFYFTKGFLSSDAEVYGATNVTMLNFSMDKFVGRNKAIFNRF